MHRLLLWLFKNYKLYREATIAPISILQIPDKHIKYHTAIPEDPLSNKAGRRAGKSEGSFCELSKFGTKSTCLSIQQKYIKVKNKYRTN
jgi:hypothetical protein